MILQFVKTTILSKKLKNFLTIFSIMISVLLIIMIQNISKQLNTNIIENINDYDLIIGKTGSSTGLVMNTVFYYGVPEGNIDISYLEKMEKNKYVKKVVPIGMGDSYRGYKIIGTTPNFFSGDNFKLKDGEIFDDEFEVVLGSTIARKSGLKIGDTFKSTHGLLESSEDAHEHENILYKIVGILEPTNTPNDTVLFTSIESLWHAHGLEHDHEHEEDDEHNEIEEHEHEEHNEETETNNIESTKILSHGKDAKNSEHSSTELITAILIRTKGLNEQFMLYQDLQNDSKIQAIIPTQALRELLNTLNIGEIVITLIASVSVVISVIMLFITMLTSSIEQRKDISILRALGANRKTVFYINIVQMLILAVIGIILGFVVAHLMIAILGNFVVTNYGFYISATKIQAEEVYIMLVTLAMSLIAGIIPALMVYRTDATKYLK